MKYPVFKKRKNSELVVCFSSETVGHVIVGNDVWFVNEYRNDWTSVENINIWEDWEPPKEKIKLYKWAYKYEDHWADSTCFYETDKIFLKSLGLKPIIIKRLDYTMIEVKKEE